MDGAGADGLGVALTAARLAPKPAMLTCRALFTRRESISFHLPAILFGRRTQAAKSDPHALSEGRQTPLHVAAYNGSVKVAQLLLKVRSRLSSCWCYLPALLSSHRPSLAWLMASANCRHAMQAKCDPRQKARQNQECLDIAQHKGHVAFVQCTCVCVVIIIGATLWYRFCESGAQRVRSCRAGQS